MKRKFALKLNEKIIICEFARLNSMGSSQRRMLFPKFLFEFKMYIRVCNLILTNFRRFSLRDGTFGPHAIANLRSKISLRGFCFAKLHSRWQTHTHTTEPTSRRTNINSETRVIHAINFIKVVSADFRFRQILLLHIIIWFYVVPAVAVVVVVVVAVSDYKALDECNDHVRSFIHPSVCPWRTYVPSIRLCYLRRNIGLNKWFNTTFWHRRLCVLCAPCLCLLRFMIRAWI